MLPFISVAGGGASQVRRDEFLFSEEILRGVIPARILTSPMRPQKIHLTGFGDLFRVNGNVIKSVHCADSHSRVRQVKDINSVLYFFTSF